MNSEGNSRIELETLGPGVHAKVRRCKARELGGLEPVPDRI